MKLPIQAQPVMTKVSTANFLHSKLVQTLSLRCSTGGEICGGFSDGSCCDGLKCWVPPGADFGYCYKPSISRIQPVRPILF
jgi:hypothetical protein